jgi:hypothetical protein
LSQRLCSPARPLALAHATTRTHTHTHTPTHTHTHTRTHARTRTRTHAHAHAHAHAHTHTHAHTHGLSHTHTRAPLRHSTNTPSHRHYAASRASRPRPRAPRTAHVGATRSCSSPPNRTRVSRGLTRHCRSRAPFCSYTGKDRPVQADRPWPRRDAPGVCTSARGVRHYSGAADGLYAV